jgi:ribosomal protein S18 acetylase RimI-like enzyme
MIIVEEYTPKYKTDLIKLMDTLMDHLVEIDPLQRLRRQPGYGENYVNRILKEIDSSSGKIFLALENEEVLGAVYGNIEKQSEEDLLAWIPTKTARVQDLVVTKDRRGKGVGTLLLEKIEQYFISQNADVIRLKVMRQNSAYDFYKKYGYEDRLIDVIKSLR